jgi:uncharacterized protein YecE (DUF72 family)
MSKLQSLSADVDAAAAAGRRLVGCAGWSLRQEQAADFPVEGSHLERYATVFPAVEINSSFYRPHRPQTYARWAASVPDGFRFSVKLPRTITHDARLAGVDELLDRFLLEAGELGPKLGCVLVQLPPKGSFDPALAADFLPRLRARFPCMLALEARQPGPHVPTTAATYLRLHGAPTIYYSSYPPEFLHKVEARLARCQERGADAWCIFDNTASGAAVPNALDVLRGATDGPWSPQPSASTAN